MLCVHTQSLNDKAKKKRYTRVRKKINSMSALTRESTCVYAVHEIQQKNTLCVDLPLSN